VSGYIPDTNLLATEVMLSDLKTPLRRSRTDRKIAGVIGGIAKHFDIDPTTARVVYVIGSIVSAAFPGVLVYVLLWVIIPEEE
jgi:phage shock protein PspC (stress-responsive transcriptional regulator)